MIRILLFIAILLTVFNSFGQTNNRRTLLINTWVVDSVINLGFKPTEQNVEVFKENVTKIKEGAHFTFNQDSTYEINLVSVKFYGGWWTLKKNDSILSIFSNKAPAYSGIPVGPPETIMEIELISVTANSAIFKFIEQGEEIFTFLVKPKIQ